MYCKNKIKTCIAKKKESPTNNVLEQSQAISPVRMNASKQPYWVSLGRNYSKANI